MLTHALAVTQFAQHRFATCGQSRRGGVETSKRTRWSRSLGRVAVIMSKVFSLKVAAPCACAGFPTFRLGPVPPSTEVLMFGEGAYRQYSQYEMAECRQ